MPNLGESSTHFRLSTLYRGIRSTYVAGSMGGEKRGTRLCRVNVVGLPRVVGPRPVTTQPAYLGGVPYPLGSRSVVPFVMRTDARRFPLRPALGTARRRGQNAAVYTGAGVGSHPTLPSGFFWFCHALFARRGLGLQDSVDDGIDRVSNRTAGGVANSRRYDFSQLRPIHRALQLQF